MGFDCGRGGGGNQPCPYARWMRERGAVAPCYAIACYEVGEGAVEEEEAG